MHTGLVAVLVSCLLALAGCATPPVGDVTAPAKIVPVSKPPAPKIALVLGGGAVRGFAHIGVIKILEAQGIVPDLVVGTSAGSVVGALYAGGYSGFELQKVALQLEQETIGDLVMPDRGFVKGEMLQNYINRALQNRPIERLNRTFAAVATDLQSGEVMVFRRGNTGMAVRASSSIPGVFQPVSIGGKEYVDGGLVSPVPVRIARSMGADIVIAVDISSKPRHGKVNDTIDIFLQSFNIMGQTIGRYELAEADVVIRPQIGSVGATEFEQKHLAIMEGEKAAQAALPLIRLKLQQKASGK
ncbi:MAG: patatin-like phospholipase family protein [Betaproteobacteria bacterium]|nr:patatin-like phospholipase family protein [Betaproteobacteria bacterium]